MTNENNKVVKIKNLYTYCYKLILKLINMGAKYFPNKFRTILNNTTKNYFYYFIKKFLFQFIELCFIYKIIQLHKVANFTNLNKYIYQISKTIIFVIIFQ